MISDISYILIISNILTVGMLWPSEWYLNVSSVMIIKLMV